MATRDPSLSGFDVAGLLAGIEPPRPAVDVTAGFFHRTLARWLGLPEGKSPGKKHQPPLWDYDFWKAELVEEGAGDAKRTYTARVFRTAAGAPESYRYWVKLDDAGRIKSSGWLSDPPDLLGDDEKKHFAAPPPLDDKQLAGLFVDD
jgi:hypothetical protein